MGRAPRSVVVGHEEARAAFLGALEAFCATARAAEDVDLLDPSRCRGWSRLDAVVHVRAGLEEMASSCLAAGGDAEAEAPGEPVEDDAVGYFRRGHPDDRDEDPVAHVLWLRRTASAYRRPSGAVVHLTAVAARAEAVVRALPDGVLRSQGGLQTTGAFLASWAVELVVHHLDLDGPSADEAPAPDAAALMLARRTVEALAEASLPPSLDDATAVAAGLGRLPWPAGLERPEGLPVGL